VSAQPPAKKTASLIEKETFRRNAVTTKNFAEKFSSLRTVTQVIHPTTGNG
jgi:hypothetical protein